LFAFQVFVPFFNGTQDFLANGGVFGGCRFSGNGRQGGLSEGGCAQCGGQR